MMKENPRFLLDSVASRPLVSSEGLLTIARSELTEEELNGSEPPSCELNGSTSPALFILLPNGSDSTALSAAELKGSLDAGGGLVVLEAKGSGAPDEDDDGAGASLALAAKRSGSGIPGVVPNGSAEAEKGSFEGKVLLEGWLKKESAAKGSEPLNGSPPKGSDEGKKNNKSE